MTAPTVTEKRCSSCASVKPADAFHRNRSRRDGLTSECRECVAERGRRYYVENAEAVRERVRRYATENAEAVAERKRRYRSENAEAERERARRYATENAEAIAERKRRYRAQNAEALREYDRRYHAENAEQRREYDRRYRAQNAEALRRYRAEHRPDLKRQARKRAAPTDDHTRAELLASWEERDLWGCALNGPTCTGTFEHDEHTIPLAQGGAHTVGNLRPSCAACNLSKGSKTYAEWRASWEAA